MRVKGWETKLRGFPSRKFSALSASLPTPTKALSAQCGRLLTLARLPGLEQQDLYIRVHLHFVDGDTEDLRGRVA